MGPVSVLSNIGVKAGEADLAWLVILYVIYCLMLLAPDPRLVGKLLFQEPIRPLHLARKAFK